ncbi:MAG TPA: 3-hydroxyacyl-CoA dehydrogenase [Aestuariivirgaceae bacterium]|nr:3-hydroxyacyl-CoA dehydrogenase [Aestuariivirgaceae bacterium]
MEGHIAIIGAGLIGRAWAIVFARAGARVVLHDVAPQALDAALATIRTSVDDLRTFGLVEEETATVVDRVRPEPDLAGALAGAGYVQECGPEVLEQKRALFARLDELAPDDAVLASSSSGFPTSSFADGLERRERCLVAHPVNPPYLVPLVEISPAPFTSPDVVEKAHLLMSEVGQQPILVQREIDGFILNRLQGALLNEAFRLAEDGFASPEDIDKAVSYGLGLRWSFMGPFETIELNAPGGIADYMRRYGEMYHAMARSQADPRPWGPELVARMEAARRNVLPQAGLADRQTWRDRRLMALAAHKRKAAQTIQD